MKRMLMGSLCLLLAALPAVAQLDGKKIQIKTDGALVSAPVTVECSDPAPEGKIVVLNGKDKYPATLKDGKLTFIVEKMKANTEAELVVKTEKAEAPRVSIEKRANDEIIDIKIDGKIFTSYYYSRTWKKPFLWPINTEGGVTITRDFPMNPDAKPQDHPHHKSMWSAFGNVNGVNCWEEDDGCGLQRVGEVTFGSGDAYGWILSKDQWTDTTEKSIVGETREYRFYATPEKGRLVDEQVTFTADQGDVKFGDTKEGGIIAVRMRPEVCEDNAFITNALGDKGEENCWGKPSPWCDYSGKLPDAGWRGLAIFDNPGNLRYPTSWHVRKYGLMAANCFGYSFFSKEAHNKGLVPENGDYLLPAGKTQIFNYRVYVHSGDVEKAKVGERYADYTKPPQASWK